MPELRTRRGVPLAKVGTWQTATGEWECTRQQLADAVDAQHDPAFRVAVLKLGHTDPHLTDGQILGDGQPAVGKVVNLRLADGGNTLVGDLIDIPAGLDEVLDVAYPSRSIEAELGVQVRGGRTYAMRVTGLALLGATPPAIESLGDLGDLFGTYIAARRLAASFPMLQEARVTNPTVQGEQAPVTASASVDELTTAAKNWAHQQPQLAGMCSDGPGDQVECEGWNCCVNVANVYTDFVVFSVWDRGESALLLYRATYSEADGVFTFSPLERVRATYEPMPPAMVTQQGGGTEVEAAPDELAAAGMPRVSHDNEQSRARGESREAVPSARGRDVTAGAHPLESTVPISPALAVALGVDAEADEETVLAAVEALRTPTPSEPPAQQAETKEGGTGEQAPAAPTTETSERPPIAAGADVQALVNAAIEARMTPVLAELRSVSGELAARKAADAETARARVLDGAVTAGKIKPADRAVWAKRYDAAPSVTTEILDALEPGTAVPVSAAGRSDIDVTGRGAEDDALYAGLFGALEGVTSNG